MAVQNPGVEMIALTLPYPVSANRYWRTFMHKGCGLPVTVASEEARSYRNEVRRLAREAGIVRPFPGRVSVSYVLYPKCPADWKRRARADPARWDDTVQCIDLDNAQKILFDALEGVVFENDRLIRHIEGERAVPDGPARVELRVESLEGTREKASVVPSGTVAEDGMSLEGRFPLHCRVKTPSGRLAEVRRHLAGASKQDCFERVICRYVDGRRADDWVTLQPRFLTRVG